MEDLLFYLSLPSAVSGTACNLARGIHLCVSSWKLAYDRVCSLLIRPFYSSTVERVSFYSLESEKLFHCSALVLQLRDCFHSNSIFRVYYTNDVVAVVCSRPPLPSEPTAKRFVSLSQAGSRDEATFWHWSRFAVVIYNDHRGNFNSHSVGPERFRPASSFPRRFNSFSQRSRLNVFLDPVSYLRRID